MDEMAHKIGIDPLKFRQLNHIKEGQGSPIFKALGEGKEGLEQTIKSCGLPGCITVQQVRRNWAQAFSVR